MKIDKIIKGLQSPRAAFAYLVQIARGYYYKCKYLRRDVKIGKRFRVVRKLIIKGPGRVRIGDDVVCDGTASPVTPWTYDKNAEIRIGNNTFLNGTRFGCKTEIEIGDNCIIADCRILDTDFHSTNPEKRNDPAAVKTAPVIIGNNVWISLGCVILRGVTIGEGATVSACSVVYDNIPAYSLYGGNPAKMMKKIYEWSL